jgi:hypothetical protein
VRYIRTERENLTFGQLATLALGYKVLQHDAYSNTQLTIQLVLLFASFFLSFFLSFLSIPCRKRGGKSEESWPNNDVENKQSVTNRRRHLSY